MRRSIAASATAIAFGAMVAIGAGAPSAAQVASLRFGGTGHRLIQLSGASSRHYAARHRYVRRHRGISTGPIVRGVLAQPGYGAARPTSIGPAPGLPAPPAYAPPTMQPTPQYYTVPGLSAYCASRFRTYDPGTNTRQDASGIRHPCP
ncbi:MAG: BA14K family protein [Hyphomicrobiales bacterium]